MVSRAGGGPPPRRGRPPRARHDAGLEPLDWGRVAVVLAVAAVASGGALATAGVLRQGPLDGLGWTDREREAVAFEPSAGQRVLNVLVDLPASACPRSLRVEVKETPEAVVLGPVHATEPRLRRPGETCPVVRTERPVAVASLRAPLGGRRVVSSTGIVVRQGASPEGAVSATLVTPAT